MNPRNRNEPGLVPSDLPMSIYFASYGVIGKRSDAEPEKPRPSDLFRQVHEAHKGPIHRAFPSSPTPSIMPTITRQWSPITDHYQSSSLVSGKLFTSKPRSDHDLIGVKIMIPPHRASLSLQVKVRLNWLTAGQHYCLLILPVSTTRVHGYTS